MKKILSMTFVLVGLLSMFALAGIANAASMSRSLRMPGSRSGASAAKPWRMLSSANPSAGGDYLYAVVALSATNAWNVGDYLSGSGKTMVDQTLIEHYNGASWSVVPSPNPGTGPNGNYLRAIAAVSASDIYAVGYSFTGTPTIPSLIEHYNGRAWNVVSSPNPGGQNFLNGLARIPGTGQFIAVGNEDGHTLAECNC